MNNEEPNDCCEGRGPQHTEPCESSPSFAAGYDQGAAAERNACVREIEQEADSYRDKSRAIPAIADSLLGIAARMRARAVGVERPHEAGDLWLHHEHGAHFGPMTVRRVEHPPPEPPLLYMSDGSNEPWTIQELRDCGWSRQETAPTPSDPTPSAPVAEPLQALRALQDYERGFAIPPPALGDEWVHPEHGSAFVYELYIVGPFITLRARNADGAWGRKIMTNVKPVRLVELGWRRPKS